MKTKKRKKAEKFLAAEMSDQSSGGTQEEIAKSGIVMMSFNMPRPWHTEFKSAAVRRHISMKDLLVEAFDVWKANEQGRIAP